MLTSTKGTKSWFTKGIVAMAVLGFFVSCVWLSMPKTQPGKAVAIAPRTPVEQYTVVTGKAARKNKPHSSAKPSASDSVAQEVHSLEALLKNEPMNVPALNRLALVTHRDLGDQKKALLLYEQSLLADAGQRIVLSDYLNLHQSKEEALAFAEDLFRANPDNSSLAIGIGRYYAFHKMPNEVGKYLEVALQDRTLSSGDLMAIAGSYVVIEDMDSADEVFKRARQRIQEEMHQSDEEKRSSMHDFNTLEFDVALAFAKRGHSEQARKILEGILQRDSKFYYAANLLEKISK